MFKSLGNIFYHILILVLSAVAALSLPYAGEFIARNYRTFWFLIEANRAFLISMEVGLAVLIIVLFKYVGKSWKDRRLSNMASKSGLVLVTNTESFFAPERFREIGLKKIRKLKEKQSLAKDVMLVCSTGASTFADPGAELHNVMQNCREAKVMLLNPFGEGAYIRAKSTPVADVTPESIRRQIVKSIEFLNGINELRQNISLKLCPDVPLFKLAVLGDYISMKFYHAGLSTREMPEYIFRHTQDKSGFYTMFYQFILSQWRDPRVPEYDFGTGELIYRDNSWNELKREKMPAFAA